MAEPAVTFCVEDTIGLKDDKYMVGVIDRTFGDVDGHEPAPQREYQDPIRKHASVPVAQFQAFMKNGVPPRGACLVSWQTEYATELILESQLELLDRTFYVGDIVSRNAFNPMSGTVIGTRAECTLLPTDAIHNGELSETVQHDTSIRGVPAEELQYIHEYKEDDLVLYNDWVGRIEELHDEVSIRLDNGFVVVVEHAHELEPDDQAVDRLSVGDKVRTKKGNLRRGRWKYGSFNPNLRPHGTIVEVRTIEISVRWLSQSYTFKPDSTTTIPRGREPPIVIGLDILDSGDLRVYDSTKNPPAMTSFEATDPSRVYHMADINVGDRVRFKDIAGASVKYDGTKMYSSELPQGKVVRIPRTETQGYDMNVYLVMQLHTTVKVLWQDLSITEDRSISLIPDPNTDDVDEVWPGEIVATKEKTDEQFEEASWAFKPAKVGVVQTVRAIDRIATVRWFENADIRYTGEDLIYPCRTGKIGTVEEDISLYDIKNVGLTRRRGDFVKIIPESQAEWITPLTDAEMQTLADRLESVPGVRLCHLFGEVIDLGLDGKLTIRLGAADTVMDVRVAPERVNLVHSNDMDSDYFNDGYHSMDDDGDGFDSYDDTDMGDASDFENMWVEYDGRVERISGDEDSAWSTEDDEEKSDASMSDAPILIDLGNGFETSKTTPELEPETPPKMLNGSAAANFDATQQQSILGNITNGANSSTPAVSAEDSESPKPGPRDPDPIPRVSMEAFNLTSGPNAPPSFLVLDTIPVQHHYVGHVRPSNSLSTRRIGKEYKILRNSLPPGIFVRTWESRLDLLRVLIIGPSDTPYEYAPFIIDMHLGCNFPSSPPEAFFHSWTDGQGPVNPNLYEDGKICLSLLGTWHADQRNENWNPAKSTVLQVLVSIMGLVLVKEPYYSSYF
jgi:ubiquitin-conjugating enzyme E2 O